MREPTEEFSRFISLDNRLFCAADQPSDQQVPAPKNLGASSSSICRALFAGHGLVSINQRQVRREVAIAWKPYTEGPALFRHLQVSFGYAMSAIAHYAAVYIDLYS
ncbi:hypothetical protein [Paraburkholderia caffeinilytica]|uniref:hypothetical protein n=1 Tax=Paraburkholderia caffeinilytica TaxID=1761016 RepID=UPI003DA100C5